MVDAYLDFAKDSGVRLTFFVTGVYPSWTDNRNKLLPLVESGQVQLANHTWTHPDLTTLSEGEIIDELTQCENLLRNTYGVTGTPFVRPPYGGRSSFTDSVCAKAGYTTATMWYRHARRRLLRPRTQPPRLTRLTAHEPPRRHGTPASARSRSPGSGAGRRSRSALRAAR